MQQQVDAVPMTAGERATGWIEAALYVLAIGAVSVVYAIAIGAGAHVVVFIVYSLLISAIGMLAITGLGDEPVRIMLSPHSWLVGLSNIVLEGGYCLMLVTISPAEGNLLVRLSIPIAVLVGLFVFGRRPTTGGWIGAGLVFLGIMVLSVTLDLAAQTQGILYGLVCAMAVAARGFSTEFHPWNRAARTIAEKIRVTGLVVLITGIAALALVGIGASLVAAGVVSRNDLVPAARDLVHVPTFVYALLVGGAIFTAMNYLQFSSVVKIRTENFIAMGAFMPLATLLLQTIAVSLGWITVSAFDWRLVPGMMIVVAGVLILIKTRRG